MSEDEVCAVIPIVIVFGLVLGRGWQPALFSSAIFRCRLAVGNVSAFRDMASEAARN